MNLNEWAKKYQIQALIDRVRPILKKPKFAEAVEQTMKNRRISKFHLIFYEQITLKKIEEMVELNDNDGYILFIALYFVIDIVHLNYFYDDNPNISIIDDFVSVIKLNDDNCKIVSYAWQIENGYDIKNFTKCLHNITIPPYFRIYFIQQLLERNEYKQALDFYKEYRPPLNCKNSNDAKSVIACLVSNKNAEKALTFVRQYCSPDGKEYNDIFYNDYIIQIYKISKETKLWDQLCHVEFSKSEIQTILNYILRYEPRSTNIKNPFYQKYGK